MINLTRSQGWWYLVGLYSCVRKDKDGYADSSTCVIRSWTRVLDICICFISESLRLVMGSSSIYMLVIRIILGIPRTPLPSVPQNSIFIAKESNSFKAHFQPINRRKSDSSTIDWLRICYTYTNHPIENSFEKMPTSFHSNRWLALERYRLNFSLIAPCALSSGTSSTPNIFSRSCRSIVYSILERVDARMPRLGIFEQALHLRKSFLWTDKVVNRLRMFAHFLLTRWNVSFVRHGWIGLFLSE